MDRFKAGTVKIGSGRVVSNQFNNHTTNENQYNEAIFLVNNINKNEITPKIDSDNAYSSSTTYSGLLNTNISINNNTNNNNTIINISINNNTNHKNTSFTTTSYQDDLQIEYVILAVMVVAVVAVVLVLIILACICLFKRSPREHARRIDSRSFLDDSFRMSFLQNTRTETTKANIKQKNQKTKKNKNSKQHVSNVPFSYPSSYRLGPKLLPNFEKITLKPSVSNSTSNLIDNSSSNRLERSTQFENGSINLDGSRRSPPKTAKLSNWSENDLITPAWVNNTPLSPINNFVFESQNSCEYKDLEPQEFNSFMQRTPSIVPELNEKDGEHKMKMSCGNNEEAVNVEDGNIDFGTWRRSKLCHIDLPTQYNRHPSSLPSPTNNQQKHSITPNNDPQPYAMEAGKNTFRKKTVKKNREE